jgi:hypothetical protein
VGPRRRTARRCRSRLSGTNAAAIAAFLTSRNDASGLLLSLSASVQNHVRTGSEADRKMRDQHHAVVRHITRGDSVWQRLWPVAQRPPCR